MVSHYSDAFFATAATIIPVLLLALSLQGDLVARLALGVLRSLTKSLQLTGSEHRLRKTLRGAIGHSLRFALYVVAFVVVLGYGVFGEFVALTDLARGEAARGEPTTVLNATLALVVAATIGALIRIAEDSRIKEALRTLRSAFSLKESDDAATNQSDHPSSDVNGKETES